MKMLNIGILGGMLLISIPILWFVFSSLSYPEDCIENRYVYAKHRELGSSLLKVCVEEKDGNVWKVKLYENGDSYIRTELIDHRKFKWADQS